MPFLMRLFYSAVYSLNRGGSDQALLMSVIRLTAAAARLRAVLQGLGADDRAKLPERRDLALQEMMRLPNGLVARDTVPSAPSACGYMSEVTPGTRRPHLTLACDPLNAVKSLSPGAQRTDCPQAHSVSPVETPSAPAIARSCAI
jgi:hypothetical protein